MSRFGLCNIPKDRNTIQTWPYRDPGPSVHFPAWKAVSRTRFQSDHSCRFRYLKERHSVILDLMVLNTPPIRLLTGFSSSSERTNTNFWNGYYQGNHCCPKRDWNSPRAFTCLWWSFWMAEPDVYPYRITTWFSMNINNSPKQTVLCSRSHLQLTLPVMKSTDQTANC